MAESADTEPVIDDSLASATIAAAIFAHEFANELSTLHSAVQVIEMEFADNTAAKNRNIKMALQHVRSGMARLDRLLSELRSLTRAQRVSPQTTDVARLIQELAGEEAPRYAARGIRIGTRFARNLPVVLLDAAKIRQALLNLCRNAADAMPGGGTLTLRAYCTRSHLHLAVIDTGEGIPPDGDVFALFTTTKPNGTGIGLTIVGQIISGHGGKIGYASVPGKGTIFRVALPLRR